MAATSPGGPSRRVALALFRAFALEARRLQRRREQLRLFVPLDAEDIVRRFGRGAIFASAGPVAQAPPAAGAKAAAGADAAAAAAAATAAAAASRAAAAQPQSPAPRLFPPHGTVGRLLRELELPVGSPEGYELGGRDILRLARRGFREGGGGGGESSEGGRLDAAIAALQVIGRLRADAACHSVTTTAAVALSAAVRVEVTTAPAPGVPAGVQTAARHFPFAYRVTVLNCGGAVVQLVSRHWLFQDSGGLRIEVPKGSPGVVGHTPILEPGQRFEYVSGVELRTASGTMRGSLHFTVPSSGGSFDAAVAETALQASKNSTTAQR